jgi:hypothetical protein
LLSWSAFFARAAASFGGSTSDSLSWVLSSRQVIPLLRPSPRGSKPMMS